MEIAHIVGILSMISYDADMVLICIWIHDRVRCWECSAFE